MLKSYSTRLAEIEEEIVFIEAQEELAKTGKMKRKVLKNEKKNNHNICYTICTKQVLVLYIKMTENRL